jgi:hypothetical protein
MCMDVRVCLSVCASSLLCDEPQLAHVILWCTFGSIDIGGSRHVDILGAGQFIMQRSGVMTHACACACGWPQIGIWERPLGLAGVWGSLVERWLYDLLPGDAHQQCDGRVSRVMEG